MVRILFVEDDQAIRQTLAAILRDQEVDVTVCESARQALGVIGEHTFDLVVTDMRMETATAGSEVIRAARAFAPPPLVVVLTAFPLPHGHPALRGASTVLLKGTDASSLIAQIKRIVADVASRPLRPPS